MSKRSSGCCHSNSRENSLYDFEYGFDSAKWHFYHRHRRHCLFNSDKSDNSLFVGEPFTQEEMEEMLSAALNPDTGQIVCKDFVPMMLVEENS